MRDEGTRMDMEQVKELFDTFSDKLPVLLNSLTDVVYGKDGSAKLSAAVADFYARLKKSGMTDEQAFALTEEYMSPLNLGGMIAGAVGRHRVEVD